MPCCISNGSIQRKHATKENVKSGRKYNFNIFIHITEYPTSLHPQRSRVLICIFLHHI
ncbi:hypothetical protein Hanom_Chr11g01002421 [Helianthus anomalus]